MLRLKLNHVSKRGYWCWVSLCVHLTSSLIMYYSGMMVVTIIGIFMSIAMQFDLHKSLNIGLNMLPSDYFMWCLDCLLGYSTGDFQALQRIVIVVFGTMDQPPTCLLFVGPLFGNLVIHPPKHTHTQTIRSCWGVILVSLRLSFCPSVRPSKLYPVSAL